MSPYAQRFCWHYDCTHYMSTCNNVHHQTYCNSNRYPGVTVNGKSFWFQMEFTLVIADDLGLYHLADVNHRLLWQLPRDRRWWFWRHRCISSVWLLKNIHWKWYVLLSCIISLEKHKQKKDFICVFVHVNYSSWGVESDESASYPYGTIPHEFPCWSIC